MSAPTWFEHIIAAHTSVTNAVSHGKRLKSDRYFVWQEDGDQDMAIDNRHEERAMHGITDLFSKVEFDPWMDALGDAFDADPNIAWALSSADYEDETGFWHYQWEWVVAYGR